MNKQRVMALAVAGPMVAAIGGLATAGPASADFVANADRVSLRVVGSGTFVFYFETWLNQPGTLVGFFEITGPKSFKATGPTDTWSLNKSWTQSIGQDVFSGTYCSTFWERHSDGSFSALDQACGPVG
jgi:hypothetical protein